MVTDGARIIHVLEGFEKGTVTQIEADAYLKATCNITLEDAQRIAQGAENTQEELAYGKKAPLMLGIFIILILTIVYMIPGTTKILRQQASLPQEPSTEKEQQHSHSKRQKELFL